jgi:hypothetical protein
MVAQALACDLPLRNFSSVAASELDVEGHSEIHDHSVAGRVLRLPYTPQEPRLHYRGALSLGLGIGANTIIFTLIDTALLRPLPYPDAGRPVMIWSIPFDHPDHFNSVRPKAYTEGCDRPCCCFKEPSGSCC